MDTQLITRVFLYGEKLYKINLNINLQSVKSQKFKSSDITKVKKVYMYGQLQAIKDSLLFSSNLLTFPVET